MLKLKKWHYLNFKGHFYLCVQWKTNAFLDVYGNVWKFHEVSQSCNMFRLIHMHVPIRIQRSMNDLIFIKT